MSGLFITGSDTGVGKTTVAAGILRLLVSLGKNARYWKPIQTGTVFGDDADDVVWLTECEAERIAPSSYRFPEPLAPWIADKRQGRSSIEFDRIVRTGKELAQSSFVIVEGAGGLLVPITSTATQADLIESLGFPVLIVSENRLGAINHTLLTIEHLKNLKLEVLGVVLTKSQAFDKLGNAESIEHFGNIRVLAEFPHREDRKQMVSDIFCHNNIREIFGAKHIP